MLCPLNLTLIMEKLFSFQNFRRAIVGGTLEFPSQLIASLLLTQWLEPMLDSWHVSSRVSYYEGERDHATATCHIFVNWMLMWPETMKGDKPATFGLVILSESTEGQ